MKFFTMIVVAMLLVVLTTQCRTAQPPQARTTEDIIRERQQINRMSQQQLNERVSRDARREARSLARAGWMTAPGALPIERQLQRSWQMQFEFDQNLFPRYIMATAMSIGGNYDAAKRQALELAIENLAGQIEREITALVENSVANQQLDGGQAVSIVRTVSESRNLIATTIGRVVPVVELYRYTQAGGREVMVRLAYNSDMAMAVAKRAVQQDLEQRGERLSGDVERIFNTRFGLE